MNKVKEEYLWAGNVRNLMVGLPTMSGPKVSVSTTGRAKGEAKNDEIKAGQVNNLDEGLSRILVFM